LAYNKAARALGGRCHCLNPISDDEVEMEEEEEEQPKGHRASGSGAHDDEADKDVEVQPAVRNPPIATAAYQLDERVEEAVEKRADDHRLADTLFNLGKMGERAPLEKAVAAEANRTEPGQVPRGPLMSTAPRANLTPAEAGSGGAPQQQFDSLHGQNTAAAAALSSAVSGVKKKDNQSLLEQRNAVLQVGAAFCLVAL